MRFWKTQNVEELNQEDSDFEISHPLVRQNQEALTLEESENFNVKGFIKKIISTSAIFLGVYLTFAGSLAIFKILFAELSGISKPLPIFFFFIAGLILTVSGVGQLKNKSDFLLYSSVPLMSFALGFLFILVPANWHGELFGWISLFFFPLILFVFYYFKEYFAPDENELK